MITFKIIFLIVCMLGMTIFLAGAGTYVMVGKDNIIPVNKSLIGFSGVLTLIVGMVFMVFMLDSIKKDSSKTSPKPKYELIQEPVYRQIN